MSLGASALACNVNPLSAGPSSDTTAPRKGPRMTSHTSTAGLALFQPAFADYLGKPVIDWVARWLVIPGGIISLVIAGFCAIWRPDYMMKGIYSFVVCLALLFVIKSADFLVNLLQQELG